jgi:hypothetical protein
VLGCRPACDIGEHWHADVDHCAAADDLVDLAEFLLGACEVNLESFNLTEPAFTFGFGDAGHQVVADLDNPVAHGRIGAEQ